jgi:hypothetical protein
LQFAKAQCSWHCFRSYENYSSRVQSTNTQYLREQQYTEKCMFIEPQKVLYAFGKSLIAKNISLWLCYSIWRANKMLTSATRDLALGSTPPHITHWSNVLCVMFDKYIYNTILSTYWTVLLNMWINNYITIINTCTYVLVWTCCIDERMRLTTLLLLVLLVCPQGLVERSQ